MWYELSVRVWLALLDNACGRSSFYPFWSYQRALVHSRVTTFVLCLQEEERREAVAVAREEEERAKELQKLARLQVKLSSFPTL